MTISAVKPVKEFDVVLRVGDREYVFGSLPAADRDAIVAAAQRIIFLSAELGTVLGNFEHAARQQDPGPFLDRLAFERDVICGEIRHALAQLEQLQARAQGGM
jgi:hypothetical protein